MRSLTLDAKKNKKTLRGNFKPSARAEAEFYKALKQVARASGGIVNAYTNGALVTDPIKMQKSLEEYSKALGPWAERQSAKLIETIQKSNKRAYQQKSKVMGELLKTDFDQTKEGVLARALLNEQVALIKSIPIEAGLRAQKIAYEAAVHGTRAQPNEDTINELIKQQGMSVEVATSRAQLIAVTETARANAAINQSRATSAGSRQYRWHNSGDGAVREAHKWHKGSRMQGKIFSWDDPPTLDDGTKGHPGSFPRCRCFAEPIFDEE